MAEIKTKPTKASVAAFLNGIKDPVQRRDAKVVASLMRSVTRTRPEMWGPTIVGFGRHRFRGASGKEAEWCLAGFSPRAQALTLYIMDGVERHPLELKKLGKHTTGRACLYIKRLDDIHLPTLRRIVASSVRRLKANRT
jgi:hypothetical protein